MTGQVAPGQAGEPCEEWLIESSADRGARIFVRARGRSGATPVILVHGFSQPASAILDVPGYSLQIGLAQAGLRVYLFDLRGYGRSTRPAFMQKPPLASLPSLGRMRDAWADLHDVADFVRRKEGAVPVDLVGYSWGTARCASFSIQANECVRRLVLYAPVRRPSGGALADVCDPERPQELNPGLGGYAIVRPGELQAQWDREIGTGDWRDFRDPGALQNAQRSLLDSDPGLPDPEPGFRFPLGPKLDALEVLRGGALFDASHVRCDALLLRGAQDRLSSQEDADALFRELGSWHKRYVTIGTGTHLLHIENNRWQLLDEIVSFLRSAGRPTVSAA